MMEPVTLVISRFFFVLFCFFFFLLSTATLNRITPGTNQEKKSRDRKGEAGGNETPVAGAGGSQIQ
jgi:hypothetical protein